MGSWRSCRKNGSSYIRSKIHRWIGTDEFWSFEIGTWRCQSDRPFLGTWLPSQICRRDGLQPTSQYKCQYSSCTCTGQLLPCRSGKKLFFNTELHSKHNRLIFFSSVDRAHFAVAIFKNKINSVHWSFNIEYELCFFFLGLGTSRFVIDRWFRRSYVQGLRRTDIVTSSYSSLKCIAFLHRRSSMHWQSLVSSHHDNWSRITRYEKSLLINSLITMNPNRVFYCWILRRSRSHK